MGVRFAVHSPYIVHELTPRKYVVGRGRQLEQEEELLLRELCFLAASMDGQRVAVKNCIAQLCPALSRVGRKKNSPMDMASPSTTARVVIRAVNRSLPSLLLSQARSEERRVGKEC